MKYQTLSKKEGLGQVVMCKGCDDVHLAIDSVTLRLPQDAFLKLSEMVQEALRHPKFSKYQTQPRLFMAERLFSRA